MAVTLAAASGLPRTVSPTRGQPRCRHAAWAVGASLPARVVEVEVCVERAGWSVSPSVAYSPKRLMRSLMCGERSATSSRRRIPQVRAACRSGRTCSSTRIGRCARSGQARWHGDARRAQLWRGDGGCAARRASACCRRKHLSSLFVVVGDGRTPACEGLTAGRPWAADARSRRAMVPYSGRARIRRCCGASTPRIEWPVAGGHRRSAVSRRAAGSVDLVDVWHDVWHATHDDLSPG